MSTRSPATTCKSEPLVYSQDKCGVSLPDSDGQLRFQPQPKSWQETQGRDFPCPLPPSLGSLMSPMGTGMRSTSQYAQLTCTKSLYRGE